MNQKKKILLVGTADTKADELLFMKRCIDSMGGEAAIMDVGVLGKPPFEPEYPNTLVATAASTTLQSIATCGDENEAMKKMAEGAVNLTLRLYAEGRVHGLLALGGTMGTDLALDVTAGLPLGMPKCIVSTVAFSHLIPPQRLAPDLMMMLWAGGLYGLNSICSSILSQSAGAILGACAAVERPVTRRPRVAIGGLGKSCLSYMVHLNPELEKRGYEPVVFHCTGMGGQAMEALIRQDTFVAVFDLAVNEVAGWLHGSVVNAGPDRLEAAGARGVPQIVAPGASDMIDFQSWAEIPPTARDRPTHIHNRLIGSFTLTGAERVELASCIADKLNKARGPTAFLLPRKGIHAWDLPGEPLHDAQAHQAYGDALVRALRAPVEIHDLDLHINDPQFVDRALEIFDRWVAAGLIPRGLPYAERS
jgi:uncharacterized protein (UPF0261 family)